MKLVRVGNLSILPMERIPWADFDNCEMEDGEIGKPRNPGSIRCEGTQQQSECENGDLEMRHLKNITPEWNQAPSKHCRQASEPGALSNGCPGRRISLSASNFSRDHLSASRSWTRKSAAPSNDVKGRAIAPRVSSSRCYALWDHHKSVNTRRSRETSSVNIRYELRSPSKSYDDRIRETVPHRGMGARRIVGTKRLGREATLCEASDCKRHSRGDSGQQHRHERGFWRVDKKLGELDLRHTLNKKENNGESGLEESKGRPEAPVSAKGSSEDDRCTDLGGKKQYGILASLLFKHSYDAEGSTQGVVETEMSEKLLPATAEERGTVGADERKFGSLYDDIASEKPCDLDIQPSSPKAVSCGEHARSSTSSKHAGVEASQDKDSRLFVDVTNKFTIHAVSALKEQPMEKDPHRLSQRQRQVDFGKNTLGYERYTEVVPRWKRTKSDPRTPNPQQVCSKRSWDGQIRKWRRLLHAYDPPLEDGEEVAEVFDFFAMTESSQGDIEVKDTRACNLLTARLEGQKHSMPNSHGDNNGSNVDHKNMVGGLMTSAPGPAKRSCFQPVSSSNRGSTFDVGRECSKSGENENRSKSCGSTQGVSSTKLCDRDEAELGLSNLEIIGEELTLSIYDWMES